MANFSYKPQSLLQRKSKGPDAFSFYASKARSSHTFDITDFCARTKQHRLFGNICVYCNQQFEVKKGGE